MSKALVIKGADFSENKLDTVTFDDSIPCTSIQLNVNTLSLTRWAETHTLVATVTPSNTTDARIWSSSDTSVATVSSSGVVTAVGVGTATITVRCGSYSASCAVSAVVRFDESSGLSKTPEYGIIAYSYTAGNDAAQYVASTDHYHNVEYGLSSGILSSYEIAVNTAATAGTPLYGVPIPANASALKITLPDSTGSNIRNVGVAFLNSKALQTSVSGVTACKLLSVKTYQSTVFSDSGTTLTIPAADLTTVVTNGADSLAFYAQGQWDVPISSISSPVTMEFS